MGRQEGYELHSYFHNTPAKVISVLQDDDIGKYIGQVFKAIENYNFERYGYKYATSIAPTLNLGAEPEIGARIAIPVKEK